MLSHTCKVIKHSRTFLRRLINLSKIVRKSGYFVCLNRVARFYNGGFASQTDGTECQLVLPFSSPTGSTQPNPITAWIAGSDHNKEARLEIPSLDQLVESYFRSIFAPMTQCSKISAKKFLSFCDASKSAFLPVTEQLLCSYVSFLAEPGLSPKSMKLY